jgi:hypothetical protein
VQALAGAVVLPVLLVAACSNRPNDLYTYYDEPSAPATTSAPAPTTTTAPVTSATPEPTDPSLSALTAQDLVAEKVQPEGAPERTVLTGLADCASPLLPTALSASSTTWKYESGSLLRQYVAIHPAGAAEVVQGLRSSLDCGTFTVDGQRYQINADPAASTPGIDAQQSWCATSPRRSTCTVALAEAEVLSMITVEATTLARARSAIVRIAPLALAKLPT